LFGQFTEIRVGGEALLGSGQWRLRKHAFGLASL